MIKYKLRVDNIGQVDDIVTAIQEIDPVIEFEVLQTTLAGANTGSAICVEFSSDIIQFSEIAGVLSHASGVSLIEYYEVNVIPAGSVNKLNSKIAAIEDGVYRPSPKMKLLKFKEEAEKKVAKIKSVPKVEKVEEKPKTKAETAAKPKKVTTPRKVDTSNPNSKYTAKNPGGDAWTQSEIETMTEMFKSGAAVKEVAEVLGRSRDSVATKKRRLGLVNLNVKPAKKVAKPAKKNNAVTPAPFTFTPEISHTYVPETVSAWTDEELDILSNNIEESAEKLAELIKRPIRQIERKRERLLDGKDR